jgi:hypothetical protein
MESLADAVSASKDGWSNQRRTIMSRAFLHGDDLRDLVAEQFGSDRHLSRVERLTGGSKKGVYRLHLDDETTTILYVWRSDENYWAPGHHLDADMALLEDAGTRTLEVAMERDPHVAAMALSSLNDALRRMHTTLSPRYGKLAAVARGKAPQTRATEDIIADRALCHLGAAAGRDARLSDAHNRVAGHIRRLRDAVTARRTYGLVHGELGPDHVMVTSTGEPVMIDFEGLVYFDIEWDHAWLNLRFGHAHPALRAVDLGKDRLQLFRYAQILSLIEGPLRIADTDFPDRQWMLNLAERNIGKALAEI